MKISNNAAALQFSPIRRFNPIAADAAKSGVKVYKLNIGQPDVETPEVFLNAIKNFNEKTEDKKIEFLQIYQKSSL